MGNAGVAFADGPGSSHVNPANLACDSSGVSLFDRVGAGGWLMSEVGVEEDTIATVDLLVDLYNDLNFATDQQALNTAGGVDDDALRHAMLIINELAHLNEDGHGAYTNIGGGFELRFGNFCLFARQLAMGGADPYSDLSFLNAAAFSNLLLDQFFGQVSGGSPSTAQGQQLAAALAANGITGDADGDGVPDNEELAFQAELALGGGGVGDPAFQQALIQVAQNTQQNAGGSDLNTLLFNGSGIEFRAVLLREIGLSAGFELPIIPSFTSVRVGATLKEVVAETFVTRVAIRDIEDGSDVVDRVRKEFDENRRRTSRFNIDLGAAVEPLPWLTIGLSGRNLIPMEFEFASPSLVDAYRVESQFKLGVGVAFGPVRAAADVDLRRLDVDQVGGLESQMVNAGVELSFLIFKLRAGAFANLAAPDVDPVYTAGLGVRVLVFQLDAAGELSARKEKVESASQVNGSDTVYLPSRFGGSVTLGVSLKF
jgi:hypothetical protein